MRVTERFLSATLNRNTPIGQTSKAKQKRNDHVATMRGEAHSLFAFRHSESTNWPRRRTKNRTETARAEAQVRSGHGGPSRAKRIAACACAEQSFELPHRLPIAMWQGQTTTPPAITSSYHKEFGECRSVRPARPTDTTGKHMSEEPCEATPDGHPCASAPTTWRTARRRKATFQPATREPRSVYFGSTLCSRSSTYIFEKKVRMRRKTNRTIQHLSPHDAVRLPSFPAVAAHLHGDVCVVSVAIRIRLWIRRV